MTVGSSRRNNTTTTTTTINNRSNRSRSSSNDGGGELSEGKRLFVANSKRVLSRSVRALKNQNLREKAKNLGNVLTRSKFFHTLVDWAYKTCDSTGKGHINRDELYSGLLLVHIKLAKFAGPAACYPPSKKVSDDLFELSDADGSGGIDRQEFNIILSVCCAQILSRIMLNYATMILVIPFVARKLVERSGVSQQGTYMEIVCDQLAGMILFLLVIPILWNRIDKEASHAVRTGAERQRSSRKLQEERTTTTTTTTSSTISSNTDNDTPNNIRRKTISTKGEEEEGGREGYLTNNRRDKYGKQYDDNIDDDDDNDDDDDIDDDESSPCPSLEFADSDDQNQQQHTMIGNKKRN